MHLSELKALHVSELITMGEALEIDLAGGPPRVWRYWRPEHDPDLSTFAELYPPDREERHHSH